MVMDRDRPGFRIETNFREILEPRLHGIQQTTNFETKVPRKDKDYTNTLNDSRFDIINKTPDCMTNVPRVPGFGFLEHTPRNPHLFGKTDTSGGFYDAKIGITKPRLDAGISRMEHVQPRKSHTIMNNGQQLSCVNIEKAVEARTIKTKPKHINLTNFKSVQARDESILKQTDRWFNN